MMNHNSNRFAGTGCKKLAKFNLIIPARVKTGNPDEIEFRVKQGKLLPQGKSFPDKQIKYFYFLK